jgi:hypothetical protein
MNSKQLTKSEKHENSKLQQKSAKCVIVLILCLDRHLFIYVLKHVWNMSWCIKSDIGLDLELLYLFQKCQVISKQETWWAFLCILLATWWCALLNAWTCETRSWNELTPGVSCSLKNKNVSYFLVDNRNLNFKDGIQIRDQIVLDRALQVSFST